MTLSNGGFGHNPTTSGTFSHNGGTVAFTPSANHTLSGATTWNNLTFSEASNDSTNSTITLPASTTAAAVYWIRLRISTPAMAPLSNN